MIKSIKVAKREYLAQVKTKGFIIGLVLAPILMSGGLIAFKISEARVDTTDKKLAVIDRSGLIVGTLVAAAEARNENEIFDEETKKKSRPAYVIEVVEPDTTDPMQQRMDLSNRIRGKELHAFLEIGASVIHPGSDPQNGRITYHGENAALDELRRWLSWPINNQLRKLRLSDAGIDESEVRDLFNWTQIEGLGLVSMNEVTGELKDAERISEIESVGVPMIMTMLIYLMIIMGTQPLLHSAMEEKSQRIAEVLLGSIRPFDFMMGKIIAGIGVSLTASMVYVVGGVAYIRYMGFDKYIPYHILPWFFAYMLLAIFMYGALNAALGAVCNDSKDAQALMFPSLLPLLLSIFLVASIIRDPLNTWSTWISMIPPFSPLLMLFRQSTPAGVPLWQPCVAIAGVLALATLTVWLGGRIFRVAILMQGVPPKLGNIVRWAIHG